MSDSGVNSRRPWRVMYVGILLVLYVVLASCTPLTPTAPPETATPLPPTDTKAIPVTVLDVNGKPFEQGVVVRVSNSSQVDDFDDGGLWIETCDPATQVIAAWAEGYEVGIGPCSNEPKVQLAPLTGYDDSSYAWESANRDCINCHAGQFSSTYNEVNEWQKTRHSNGFNERYFETMYRGTNLRGISGPVTQWRVFENHRMRIPPIIDDRYYGPGFKLDYPDQPGNCAVCHVPTAITPSQQNVDLSTSFSGNNPVWQEGITCDVCHKVWDVALDKNGFPFAERPGILSFKFLRPDSRIFTIGPFANIQVTNPTYVVDHHLTCSSIFSKSEFCAACHYGKFGDMVIYNSYGEWKQSPYGENPNKAYYRTCQDCHMSHMQSGDSDTPASRRQACSESNSNFQDFSHNLMNMGIDENTGQEIPLMIKNAANLDVKFKYEPDKKNSLNVIVKVVNARAGHKFPTDSPLRHLILVIEAKDQFGTSLLQVDGERIPTWGGMGKPFMDGLGIKNYGGMPGKIFANLLVEEDTNVSPTGAYWNETKYAWTDGTDNSDTRLDPGEENKSEYSFTVPDNGQVTVKVTLVYRYAFFDLIAQKEWWNRADIVVTSLECKGPPKDAGKIDCETIP